MSKLRKVRELISADSPGYTSKPRVDIRAHRSNARFGKWLSVGFVALAVYLVSGTNDLGAIGAVAAFAALLWVASLGLRVQALEWENQLQEAED